MSLSRCLAVLLILSLTMQARAGTPPFEDVRVSPNPASSGQPVTLIARWNTCDPVGGVTTSIAGSIITVNQVNEALCGTPPPPRDVSYPLGAFAAGNYTARYVVDFTDPGTPDQTTDVPFVVTGTATASALPANATIALVGLAVVLILAVRRGLLRRAGMR